MKKLLKPGLLISTMICLRYDLLTHNAMLSIYVCFASFKFTEQQDWTIRRRHEIMKSIYSMHARVSVVILNNYYVINKFSRLPGFPWVSLEIQPRSCLINRIIHSTLPWQRNVPHMGRMLYPPYSSSLQLFKVAIHDVLIPLEASLANDLLIWNGLLATCQDLLATCNDLLAMTYLQWPTCNDRLANDLPLVYTDCMVLLLLHTTRWSLFGTSNDLLLQTILCLLSRIWDGIGPMKTEEMKK